MSARRPITSEASALPRGAAGLRVLLVDDHAVVRHGVGAILAESDFEIVGEAEDGVNAINAMERLKPDVLVIDLTMPGITGLEVSRRVRPRYPHTRIVILSQHEDAAAVVEAFAKGADAYVLKTDSARILLCAVRGSAGQRFLSPSISQDAVEELEARACDGKKDPYERLTPREREVLQLTARGCTSRELGEELGISSRTVENHRETLMKKLSLRNQRDLVRYALRRRLIPL